MRAILLVRHRDTGTAIIAETPPECLRFFASDRAVFTPSSEQVRRPINDDSMAVFRGFAPCLGELSEALAAAEAAFPVPPPPPL